MSKIDKFYFYAIEGIEINHFKFNFVTNNYPLIIVIGFVYFCLSVAKDLAFCRQITVKLHIGPKVGLSYFDRDFLQAFIPS